MAEQILVITVDSKKSVEFEGSTLRLIQKGPIDSECGGVAIILHNPAIMTNEIPMIMGEIVDETELCSGQWRYSIKYDDAGQVDPTYTIRTCDVKCLVGLNCLTEFVQLSIREMQFPIQSWVPVITSPDGVIEASAIGYANFVDRRDSNGNGPVDVSLRFNTVVFSTPPSLALAITPPIAAPRARTPLQLIIQDSVTSDTASYRCVADSDIGIALDKLHVGQTITFDNPVTIDIVGTIWY